MHMTNTPDTADIPVVILCGGQGTRIREASEKLPKPLIDIGGKPILWHIMKIYSEHGFRRFVLCLGYKAWDIKEHFLRYKENNSDFTLRLGGGEPEFHSTPSDDFEISFVDTGLMTGTGGRIGRVAHLLDQEHFMLTYGDGIGNVDLSAEKPDTGGRVSGGFFAFKTDFLRYITSETDLFLEQEPLRKLASDGELGMYRHNGFWMGMDTFREYSALNDMWENDLAPWRTWAD